MYTLRKKYIVKFHIVVSTVKYSFLRERLWFLGRTIYVNAKSTYNFSVIN